MKAMVLSQPGRIDNAPLQLQDVPMPEPKAGEVLIRVEVCGVCRTDLHVIEGELPPHKQPIIPGHEVVGYVDLFLERNLRSVTANTRQDGNALLQLAETIPLHTYTQEFPLAQANEALLALKRDQINGAAVLRVSEARASRS